MRRHYKDDTVKLEGSVSHGAEHFLRAAAFWVLMKTALMRMRPQVLLVWLVTLGETENTSAP